jgi:transposase
VEACLRQIDFLDAEVELVDRELAAQAVGSEDIRGLLTIPGISVTVAAAFMAAVGIGRFPPPTPGHLSRVGPTVRQSGSSPARHGSISKQGSKEPRQLLVAAAWAAARTPRPLNAFAERGARPTLSNSAIVAVTRKLARLCWHLLVRDEDYAFMRPSLIDRRSGAWSWRSEPDCGEGAPMRWRFSSARN